MAESPLGSPIMLTTPARPEADIKKLKAKKKPSSLPAMNSMVTRSQGKRSSGEEGEVMENEETPLKKKKKIIVEGTLGHGDNAVQIHPDSQALQTQAPSATAGDVKDNAMQIHLDNHALKTQAVSGIAGDVQSDTETLEADVAAIDAATESKDPSTSGGETLPSEADVTAIDAATESKDSIFVKGTQGAEQTADEKTEELLKSFSVAELTLLRQLLDKEKSAAVGEKDGIQTTVSNLTAPAPAANKSNAEDSPPHKQAKSAQAIAGKEPGLPTTPSAKFPPTVSGVNEASLTHKTPVTKKVTPKSAESPPRSSPSDDNKTSFTPMKSSPPAGLSPSPSPRSDKSKSDDTTIYPARGRIPTVCQVIDEESQDPMLAHKYAGLTPLNACDVGSTSKDSPGDFYPCSQWVQDIPTMDIELVLSALNFDIHGTNVNPARANPEDLGYRESQNRNKIRRELYIGDAPALCWTPVFVRKSDLTQLTKAGQKAIVGVPHCQEIDRLTAALAMSFGISAFKTNFYQSGLSFNTYGYNASGTTFSGRRSRLISGNVVDSAFSTLGNRDTVFVFDCRNWEKLTLTDILGALEGLRTRQSIVQKMGELGFDLFNEEIPVGSCAVIAHTVNVTSDAKDSFMMNFNIQFALLMGVPPKSG